MNNDASLKALNAAKALVADIEFFRTHGTGEMNAKYPDHRAFDGYSWIVRRARKMTRQLTSFAGGGPKDPDPIDLLHEIMLGIEDMRRRKVIDESDDDQWLDAKLAQTISLLSDLRES
jgi:hypothetical protein